MDSYLMTAVSEIPKVRRSVRNGLLFAFTLAFASMGFAPAHAATTVSGDKDTNAPLVIDPATTPTDPLETRVYASGAPDIFFIQEMPVTKTINQVTLGDIAQDAGCTTAPTLRLYVREWASSDRLGGSNQIEYSRTTVTLDDTFRKQTWAIPPTTLRKDKAYSFRIGFANSPGCSYVRLRTWAHNRGQVDGGSARCTAGPPLPSAAHIEKRLWHETGVGDLPADTPCTAVNFKDNMPSGWLGVYKPSSIRVRSAMHAPGDEDFNACEDTRYASNPILHGAEEVFWEHRDGETNPWWICRWTQFAPLGEKVPHGWYYGLPWPTEAKGAPRDVYLRLDTIDYDALLAKYVPQLRYDEQEVYRADAADIITLPYETGLIPIGELPLLAERANNLERENGAVMASADPRLGYPRLTLAFLPAFGADVYPSGDAALDEDRIDERNGSYQEDAAAGHANADLKDTIYSRVAQDEDGKIWLQYWFFYYYNQAPFFNVFGGDHEADWEMIQVGLKGDLNPDVATYAQHATADADACTWDRVPKSGERPIVFVERGTHASYFTGGVAYENGEKVVPRDVQIRTASPSWVTWRGRWGGSSESRVSGPGRQGTKWDDPKAFNEIGLANGCPPITGGSGAARTGYGRGVEPRMRTLVARPKVAARRKGRYALVRYRFQRINVTNRRRSASVFITVHSADKRQLPRGKWFHVRGHSGRVKIQLPSGSGPYRVLASGLSKTGERSAIARARLR